MLLHLINGPIQVVQIMVVCSMAIQSLSVWSLRREIAWRALLPFLLGGLASLPLGVYLLLHLHQAAYARLIGAALIAYGAWMLVRPPLTLRRTGGAAGDAAAGFVGGITGGLAGFPGAFVTIWCGLRGWDKRRQRGVYQPFILAMQSFTLAAIHLIAPAVRTGGAPPIDLATLSYIPAALLGTWCGLAIFRRLTDAQFAVTVNLLLIGSGGGLLF